MIRFLLRWMFQVLFRVSVTGDLAHLVASRSLVVANHLSLLDPFLLSLFLPGPLTVVVSSEFARHWLCGRFMRRFGFVVVDPSRPLGIKRLIQRVRNGEPVALLPEARVSTTGSLMKVYDSAGVIAARCDARLVPVIIRGTGYGPGSGQVGRAPRRWFPRITLRVCEPVSLVVPKSGALRERRRQLADQVLRALQGGLVESRERATLFEGLLEAVTTYGRRTVIIEDAMQRETYGGLLKKALMIGRIVGKLGGDREVIGVILPNLIPTVALVLGCARVGRVPAMLNYTAGPDAVRDACVAGGIRTVITSKRFVAMGRLDVTMRALADIRVVYLEDLASSIGIADKLWLIFFALPFPRATLSDVSPRDAAVVLFTSGSEAHPKGVAISHDAMLSNMAQMHAVIDFGPNDRFLNALPMYHTYGLTACTLMPLMTGTRLFLYTNPLHYRAIPEFSYTKNCTYIFGTSTFLGHYGRQAHPYDFHGVRVVVSGGEKLNGEVAELWLRKFGLRIMEGYGATECGPAMALNTPLVYREGTVGRFLPQVEHCLVPVPGIESGAALHVRSPCLMNGYFFFERPGVLHPPRSEVGEGWYHTGDVVEVDDEGFLTIVGRVKRFAKIAGEMVSLELVERIAYEAAPGYKHAATVEEITGRGESTVLFTTAPRLDRVTLAQAARALGAQELAVARRVVHVPGLPLLGSGKTDYVTLRKLTVDVA